MLAWPIMSLIIHLKDAHSALTAFYDLLLYIAFVLFVFLGTGRFVRLLLKYFGAGAQFSDTVGGIILVWFIGMLFLADMIAVHVIVTAYMLGCAMPREGPTIKVSNKKYHFNEGKKNPSSKSTVELGCKS